MVLYEQFEHVNRVIKIMLAQISEPVQHSDWSKLLTKVEYAINNFIHFRNKETPYANYCSAIISADEKSMSFPNLGKIDSFPLKVTSIRFCEGTY